ncbi:MAG TPA: hypothetical protein VK421_06295 [Pyrinomonadaceae bacterium]|nr:hypothetical protein [Pyrinomonadaceae bacterium]
MGLGITAHEKLAFISPKDEADAARLEQEYEDGENGVIKIWISRDFPRAADKLADGAFYRSEGKDFRFRAGAYSSYNRWRESLARMIGETARRFWNDPRPGPFVELINFSDCEGVIGPETSAKLARDFQEYAERAERFRGEADWLTTYQNFRKAFELAAGGGCVRFH